MTKPRSQYEEGFWMASRGGPGLSTRNGNNEVGEGRLTIQESKPGELVRMKLEFRGPLKRLTR